MSDLPKTVKIKVPERELQILQYLDGQAETYGEPAQDEVGNA